MAGRFWREAATLIIVGRAAFPNNKVRGFPDSNYNILLLKRNNRSSFMPGASVFPGGVVEASDFCEDWLNVFEKCGYTASDLRHLRNSAPLPELYTNKPAHYILPEIGFRIGAIRETFEESGILLARHLPRMYHEQHEVDRWRRAIQKDANKFLAMFHEIGGCPAVWDLHEWISWLTPSSQKGRRFNTIFFITFLDSMPKPAFDDEEVVGLQVISPPAVLQEWYKGNVWLPPPQAYEISRFLNFQCFEKLKRFAHQRGKKGLDHYFPVVNHTINGIVSFLPGDDLYPEHPDYSGEQGAIEIKSTLEELQKTATHLNRFELEGNVIRIIVNVVPKYGHVQALDFLSICGKSEF
ncbi:acyl-coenzyme A diphosphatase NUDT19-like isoform X1 [Panulirus ornatus]|uniref:acyl-coenzyme A diphosphatase NUDT19-like isoform X1 n=1 Tax=Panulirus ornatus TaxID=150431 RepID=UPI003A842719